MIDSKLSPWARCLYHLLDELAYEGRCREKQTRLAERLKIGRTLLIELLEELRACGAIQTVRRRYEMEYVLLWAVEKAVEIPDVREPQMSAITRRDVHHARTSERPLQLGSQYTSSKRAGPIPLGVESMPENQPASSHQSEGQPKTKPSCQWCDGGGFEGRNYLDELIPCRACNIDMRRLFDSFYDKERRGKLA